MFSITPNIGINLLHMYIEQRDCIKQYEVECQNYYKNTDSG